MLYWCDVDDAGYPRIRQCETDEEEQTKGQSYNACREQALRQAWLIMREVTDLVGWLSEAKTWAKYEQRL